MQGAMEFRTMQELCSSYGSDGDGTAMQKSWGEYVVVCWPACECLRRVSLWSDGAMARCGFGALVQRIKIELFR